MCRFVHKSLLSLPTYNKCIKIISEIFYTLPYEVFESPVCLTLNITFQFGLTTFQVLKRTNDHYIGHHSSGPSAWFIFSITYCPVKIMFMCVFLFIFSHPA